MEPKRIFGIGLSRTGTVTLDNLLTELGFRVTHYPLWLFLFPEQIRLDGPLYRISYVNIIKKRRIEYYKNYYKNRRLDKGIDQYDAFLDLPIPLFYKHLSLEFPNAKFILTTREVGSWLESMRWLFSDGAVLWRFDELDYQILYAVYGVKRFNESRLRSFYDSYHEDVEDFFCDKRDRLLRLDFSKEKTPALRVAEFLEVEPKDIHMGVSNARKDVSFGERLDYWMFRALPGYMTFKHVLLRLRVWERGKVK